MKRTPQEIEEAVQILEALIKVMPAQSTFGDDNHGQIRVQIEVLRGTIHNTATYPYWDLLDDMKEWIDGGSDDWLQDTKDDLKTFA